MLRRNPIRELGKQVFMYACMLLGDDIVVAVDHMRVFGRLPNLEAPSSFTDKIQHHKLNVRDERLPQLVDKIAVKDHVAQTLGRAWVTPTLWSGEQVSPSILRVIAKPAVLKVNHASGFIAFLDDDSDLDDIARRANAWPRHNYHLLHREWAYGEVRRRLFIEPQIAPPNHLNDYKFWLFDGRVELVQVDRDRFSGHTRQFYDRDWRKLDLALNYPSGEGEAPAPAHLARMIDGAERLARGLPFVRVDLYDLPDAPRFGELTFWPEAGLCKFDPPDWDARLGAIWRYPIG